MLDFLLSRADSEVTTSFLRLVYGPMILALLALGFVLAGCGPSHKAQFGAGLPKVPASPQEAALEREMFERLNHDRIEHGLPALSYDQRLADIARYHSRDMRDNGFFGHVSPTTGSPQDRIDRAGYLARESRENVAQAPDAPTAQAQLLASPGHRANIMAKTVTHVGVGVVRDRKIAGQVRGYYFTQLFATPAATVRGDQARQALLEKIARARREAGLAPLTMHPLLERFAKEHVHRVDADEPGRTLGEIGDAVVGHLSQQEGHALQAVEAAAQVGLGVDMLRPQDLVGQGVRAVGFAIAEDQDAQGKPVVKLLMIVGR